MSEKFSQEMARRSPKTFEVSDDLQKCLRDVLRKTADPQQYRRYLVGLINLVWANCQVEQLDTGLIKLIILDFDHTDASRIFSTSSRQVKVGLQEVSDFFRMSI